MVATLGKRRGRWDEINAEFGTVIVDEADTLTHPTLNSFVHQSPAKYIIGATATARPEDQYLGYVFGKPVAGIEESDKMANAMPLKDVTLVRTEFEYKMQKGAVDFLGLTQAITENVKRNELIAEEVFNDWSAGHSVLIATRNVVHVHEIYHLLQDLGVEDVNMLTGETNTKRSYTKELIRNVRNRNIRCVVATYQAIKRGANLNALDRLHLVCPLPNSRDIIQLVGRIRRVSDEKEDCIMRYYFDYKVPYMKGVYNKHAVPAFKSLNVPRYKDLYLV